MKREELVKTLRACSNCTYIAVPECPHAGHCAQYRDFLLAEAADALEGETDEGSEQ